MQMPSLKKWSVLAICSQLLVGCVTNSEKEKLEVDIFDLQTRLLLIENHQRGGFAEQKTTTKTVANYYSKLEKLQLEINRLSGLMGGLEVGVRTGKLPGTQEGEPSIGLSLANLETKIEAITAKQEELLAVITKAKADADASSRAAANRNKKTREADTPSINSYGELEQAFASKKYKLIAANADKILKKVNKNQKQNALFMISEGFFHQGSYKEAALYYNDFIDSGAKTNLSLAKIRLGDSFRKMGDKPTAKLYYEELMIKHPDSKEASIAKDRLKKL